MRFPSPCTRSAPASPLLRAIVVGSVLTSVVSGPMGRSDWIRSVHAAPTAKEITAARKAFAEGLDLERAEKWTEARQRFEDVAKVRMTPEVRFHIALCEEHEGLLLESLRDFEIAESDARAEKRAVVVKEAPEHAAAIKPRIPRLKFKIPSDVENLSVTLDAMPIDPTGADELPVNPGEHKIEATADKRTPFAYTVTLAEGDKKTVNVSLPSAADERPAPEPPEEPTRPAEDLSRHEATRKTPTLAYVAGGVGVASLLGAGVFYWMRSSAKNDLEQSCVDLRCPADKADTISSGKTYTTLTNVFGVLGIAGLGASAYLYLTAPKTEAPKPTETARVHVHVVPTAPGADVAGVAIAGSF